MIDKILAELRLTDLRVAEGSFTLARQKAREKLSRYRLPSPNHYILEFVQAAHLLGASRIDIEADTDEMKMTFDGDGPRRVEVENIYRAGFAGEPHARGRAIERLAIGLSAVWALDPAEVVISVDNGESAVRAELFEDGEDSILTVGSQGEARTTIYIRERRRLSHIVRFFSTLRHELPEESLLIERCSWSEIEITVNGEQISHGHLLPPYAVSRVSIETEHENGVLGLEREPLRASASVRILTHGVFISEMQLPGFPFGFTCLLDSTRVGKSLSQTEILRDETWVEIRNAVVEDAAFRALGSYLESYSGEEIALNATRLRDIAARVWAYRPSAATDAYEAVRDTLRWLPIWKYAYDELDPEGRELASLRHLVETYEDSPLPVSTIDYRGGRSSDLSTTVLVTEPYRHVFEEEFDGRLRPLTSAVESAAKRAELLTELEALGRPLEPSPQGYLAHRRIERDGVVAFVGVAERTRGARAYSRIEWTNEELILNQRTAGLDLGGVHIWFGGALELRMDGPLFETSEAYLEVAAEVVRGLPAVVAEAARGLKRRELVRWLNDLTDQGTPQELARDLELRPAELELLVRHGDSDSTASCWLELAGAEYPDSSDAIAARIAMVGNLASLPLVTVSGGETMSLQQLFESHRDGREIAAARSVSTEHPDFVTVLGGWKTQLVLERFLGPIESDPAISGPTPPEFERDEPTYPDSPPARPAPSRAAGGLSSSERERGQTTGNQRTNFAERFEERIEASDVNDDQISVALAETRREIVLELGSGGYKINPAHPLIADALAQPESASRQLWATTAIYTALAAGGGCREREFAFRQLVDLLEEQ